MPKKVHVRANAARTLYFDFYFKNVRCREYTALADTPSNRRRCELKAQLITAEMAMGEFNYSRHFSNGTKRHLFSGKPDGRIEFRAFAEDIWLPHIRNKIREPTAEEYKAILRARVYEIDPKIGRIALHDLTPDHLDKLQNALRSLKGIRKQPISARRMNIILLRVRSILDLAYSRGYLDQNPHNWVTLQDERKPDVDPFSFDEQSRFLKSLSEIEKGSRKYCPNFWKNYFIVAFDTGLRPSEQLSLRWQPVPERPDRSSYVDFERKKLFIREGIVRGEATDLKNEESHRAVDMLPTVETALHDQMAGATSITGYVFPNAIGGSLDLTNIRNRIWYPALEKAGLRRRDLYQTRHTFASLMLQSGEDPNWIAKMMGHANTRTLHERYSAFIRHRTRRDGAAYLDALRQHAMVDEDLK